MVDNSIWQVTNNCAFALKIDSNSTKALYRRAYALVAKKDNEAAKADLLQAQKNAPGDKAVATLLRKVGNCFLLVVDAVCTKANPSGLL